jgi:arylsulfatase A-like enzyme
MKKVRNFILIVLDSFRQDHIGYYNRGERIFEKVPACRTPNLDSFAEESIVFHNAYPSGLQLKASPFRAGMNRKVYKMFLH